MKQPTDPVETIKELYEEDTRRVPYPVFMRCYDKLLADPPDPAPASPSDELREHFRAVCMALDLGVADRQGRAEDRKEEFDEHILPVWKEYLPDSEWQSFREILEGTFRRRLEEQRRRKQMQEAKEHRRLEDEMTSEATRERGAKFASALDAAMRETGEEEEEEAETGAGEYPPPPTPEVEEEAPAPRPSPGEPTPPGPAPSPEPEPPEEEEEEEKEERRAPVARTINALCRALTTGNLPVSYSAPEERTPLAQYKIGEERIAVRLMQKDDSFYVVLGYGRSLRQVEGIQEKAASLAADRGYKPGATWTYEKAVDEAAQQIRLGNNSTYVTCRRAKRFGVEELAETIRRMHEDLIHLLGGVQAGGVG